jgi:hypothetical protein
MRFSSYSKADTTGFVRLGVMIVRGFYRESHDLVTHISSFQRSHDHFLAGRYVVYLTILVRPNRAVRSAIPEYALLYMTAQRGSYP